MKGLENHRITERSCRICLAELELLWPPARRNDFLFRCDVLVPLSIDSRSWPLAPSTSREGCIPVVFTEVDFALDFDSAFNELGETEMLKEMEFFGYDVGDRFKLSTLSNCGFAFASPSIMSERKAWADKVNQFHLFDSIDDARAFCQYSDETWVPEHAPAQVYGVWMNLTVFAGGR